MSTSTAPAVVAGANKSLLARARDYDNLTAWERTILKVLRYCLVVGVIAGFQVIAQALTSHTVDWAQLLKTAAATGGTAALLALVKYLKASNEMQIAGKDEATGRTAGPTQPKAAITMRGALHADGV